jgi:hypothetical protein
MIKPPALMKCFAREETERVSHTFARLAAPDPISLGCNADCGQAETCRSGAGDVTMIVVQRRSIDASTIRNQACLRISFVKKVLN